jgi:hypothetical protein
MIVQEKSLLRAIEAIALAGGSEPEEATLVAENLVTANLTGHDSHGIGMMPRYVEALLEGGLHPNRQVEVKFDAGALAAPATASRSACRRRKWRSRARGSTARRSLRSAIRTTSAASATGRRWRSPRVLCRCIS